MELKAIVEAYELIKELEELEQLVFIEHRIDYFGKIVAFSVEFYDYKNTGKSTLAEHKHLSEAIMEAGNKMKEYLKVYKQPKIWYN